MTDTDTKTIKRLSDKDVRVNDVKFYFRPGCTEDDLNDFRQKAWAQINSGASQQDKATNW